MTSTFNCPKRAAAESSPRLQKRRPQCAQKRGTSPSGRRHLQVGWTMERRHHWEDSLRTGRKRSKSLPMHQSTCRAGPGIGRPLDGRTPTAHGPREHNSSQDTESTARTVPLPSKPRSPCQCSRLSALMSEPDGWVMEKGRARARIVRALCSHPSKTPRPDVAKLAMMRPVVLRINHQSLIPKVAGP